MRYFSKVTKAYTTRGEPITGVYQFTPNLQLVIAEKGEDFIPIAVKLLKIILG